MYRRSVNRATDKGFFSRTASTVRAINLPGRVFRGGFRF